MKKVCEFSTHRSEVLLRNFRESISRQSRISAKKAFREAAESPAPRFWVSEARATRIITSLLKGVDLTEGMYTEKRKMYCEILRRVKEALHSDPERAIGDIVFEVVNSPAPSSYLTWDRAAKLIYKAKRKI